MNIERNIDVAIKCWCTRQALPKAQVVAGANAPMPKEFTSFGYSDVTAIFLPLEQYKDYCYGIRRVDNVTFRGIPVYAVPKLKEITIA